MEIVNGKWVDSDDSQINHFNFSDFKKIKESLIGLYGEDISYEKISVMCYLLNKKEASGKLSRIIADKETLKQL
jgi:hypothetical protein